MNANQIRVGNFVEIGGLIRKATARDIRLLEDTETPENLKPKEVKLDGELLRKANFELTKNKSWKRDAIEITHQEFRNLKTVDQLQNFLFVKNNFEDIELDLFEVKES